MSNWRTMSVLQASFIWPVLRFQITSYNFMYHTYNIQSFCFLPFMCFGPLNFNVLKFNPLLTLSCLFPIYRIILLLCYIAYTHNMNYFINKLNAYTNFKLSMQLKINYTLTMKIVVYL